MVEVSTGAVPHPGAEEEPVASPEFEKLPGAGLSTACCLTASEKSLPAAAIQILERFGNASDSKIFDPNSQTYTDYR